MGYKYERICSPREFHSLGNNISPNIVKKKSPVLKNSPVIVGAPAGEIMLTNLPKNLCKMSIVSGLENKKKTKAL